MYETEHSSNDRLMASIAHGSVVLTGPGVIVAVLIWLTRKEESRYAAAQALQAAVYQMLGTIAVMALWTAYGVFVTIVSLQIFRDPAQYENSLPPLFWPSMASILIPFAAMVIWWAYGLWGALQSWRGEDFHYIFLGKLRLME